MVRKLLITGASSFIGRRFLRDVLDQTGWEVYSLGRLGSTRNLNPRVKHLYHDLRAVIPDGILRQVQDAAYLVHLAADVSGARSLVDPHLAVTTNVVGTFNVLELARRLSLERLVFVSTGEAVGAAEAPHKLAEDAPLRPSNPYAASKAAGEALVNSYRVSFGVPGLIVRPMNVFGPGQQLTRFVPLVVDSILNGQPVVCHVDPRGRSGSRCWLHVDKVSRLLLRSVTEGTVGGTYHLVGPERTNQNIIEVIGAALGVRYKVKHEVPGRSHDLRYALRDTKLGTNFEADFNTTLIDTAVSFKRRDL